MTKIVNKLFITVILIIFFSLLFFLSPSILEIRPNIQINSDFKCVIDVSSAKLSFSNLKIKIYNKNIKNISLDLTDDAILIDGLKVSKLFFSKVFEIKDGRNSNEDIVLSSVKYFNLINIYYFCILAIFFVFLTLLITIFQKRIESLININKINVSFFSKIISPFISDRKLFQPFKLNNNESLTNKILNNSYLIFFLLTIILGVYLRLYTGPGVDLWFDE
ncbi:MAG TPA: hypothetical protein PLG34_13830, partial [Spirochaetota bacterium]|nr:hypothetical protein [Spirochaetota bacterium]